MRMMVDALSLSLPTRELLSATNMHVDAGEILAIVGASGCGKSSLLRALSGWPHGLIQRGHIAFFGADDSRKALLVAQNVAGALQPDLRLHEQCLALTRAALTSATSGALSFARFKDYLHALRGDQTLALDRRWSRYSGGEQRSVMLALGLSVGPAVLLADEPSAGLDSKRIAHLQGVLRAYANGGAAVILATHDLELARTLADRTLRFIAGRLLTSAMPAVPIPVSQVRPGAGDLLVATQLAVSYGPQALFQGLSLQVGLGDCVFLSGKSGSGKSSALRCLAGLQTPSGGSVLFRSRPLPKPQTQLWQQLRAHIQLVAQSGQLTLNPGWLARAAADEFNCAQRQPINNEQIQALAVQLNLDPHRLLQQVASLSIGEAQRVAIMRALLVKPELLLLDEPTANLDERAVAALVTLFERQLDERRIALIVASHDMRLAAQLRARVVNLDTLSPHEQD